MERYEIVHKWNDDPDYEAFARSLLDLLLYLEENKKLDQLLRLVNKRTSETVPFPDKPGTAEAS